MHFNTVEYKKNFKTHDDIYYIHLSNKDINYTMIP